MRPELGRTNSDLMRVCAKSDDSQASTLLVTIAADHLLWREHLQVTILLKVHGLAQKDVTQDRSPKP